MRLCYYVKVIFDKKRKYTNMKRLITDEDNTETEKKNSSLPVNTLSLDL